MTSPQHNTGSAPLARDVQEALIELSIAVQKRAIYPPSHPVLSGAVEGVHERLATVLASESVLAIGVADRRLMVGDAATDPAHPHLGELAARLSSHLVASVRIVHGVPVGEIAGLVAEMATSVDAVATPLGRRTDLSWDHVQIDGIAFDRLSLLGHEGDTASPHQRAWEALALLSLSGTGGGGEGVSPEVLARLLSEKGEFDSGFLEQFEGLFAAGGIDGGKQVNHQVDALVQALGREGLAPILAAAGVGRTMRIVDRASTTLSQEAVLELLRAAAEANGTTISGALLRMIQKLSATEARASRRAQGALRQSIRRLLEGWTLENPNPEIYQRGLDAAARHNRRGSDHGRDRVSPELQIDLSIETGVVTQATELALARLSMSKGLTDVVALLEEYPASPTRELLVDRLLNESSLREYLAQPALEMSLLRQAVDRMRSRAIEPVIEAMANRSNADGAALGELLTRIGWDALPALGVRMSGAHPHLLRQFIGIFDALDAWPPQVDPTMYARHEDFFVRREALKYLFKSGSTRDEGIAIALADPDARIIALGLQMLPLPCSATQARQAIRRFDDEVLTQELRVRVIRAVGASDLPDALPWLTSHVKASRRWWFGPIALGKPSPEALAAVRALAQYHGGAVAAQRILHLARTSRAVEYHRAIERSRGDGPS